MLTTVETIQCTYQISRPTKNGKYCNGKASQLQGDGLVCYFSSAGEKTSRGVKHTFEAAMPHTQDSTSLLPYIDS